MEQLKITRSQYDALRKGFETALWEGPDPKESKQYEGKPEHQEAFLDGTELRRCIYILTTADTNAEYDADLANYDGTANRLNRKYGKIAYLDNETANLVPAGGRGLVGCRTRWGMIVLDGAGEEKLTEYGKEVAENDARYLSELHFADE